MSHEGDKYESDTWIEGCYYQPSRALRISRSLDEEFDKPFTIPADTAFVCESCTLESYVPGVVDDVLLHPYRILKSFDPRDLTNNSFIRLGFFYPEPFGFRKIENELTCLALATTGLI